MKICITTKLQKKNVKGQYDFYKFNFSPGAHNPNKKADYFKTGPLTLRA